MKVKVTNRSKSTVVYSILEDNITRFFAPGEPKSIDVKEIEKLTYQPGGTELLKNFLLIEDKQVVSDIVGPTEIEYWMKENEIKEIMLNGSYDEFLDMLDFAPDGGIDIVKTLAVTLPLTDMSKLNALKRITGFDAAEAIRHNRETEEDEQPQTTKQRRVCK